MIDQTARAPIVVGVPGEATRHDIDLPVRWAAATATTRGAPLWLVSAYLGRDGRHRRDALGAAAHEAVGTLEATAARVAADHPNLPVAMFARCGTPVGVLGDVGADARLVVVGRRGRGRVAEALQGSLTAGRGRRVSTAVVVVPRAAVYVDRQAPIVVGIGPRGPAASTLGFVYAEAALSGAPVRFIHCRGVRVGGSEQGTAAGTSTDRDDLLGRVEPYLAAFPGVRTSVEIVDGHPAEVLTKESVTAGLIVLGPGRGWTAGWRLGRLGPVGHDVLSGAASPVVLVRDTGDRWRAKGLRRP